MTFPQLNAGSRIATLAAKILSAATPEEAKNLFFSMKGGILRSRLKKHLINANFNANNVNSGNSKIDFLIPPPKNPVFLPPSTEKAALQARLAKWHQISDNLAKMDTVILKEWRERRAEYKSKSKKNNYPF